MSESTESNELSPGNSTVIQHTVTNPLANPIYVNDATVTVTITDSNGVDLIGESWPVTLPYVTASNGVYRKIFDPFANLVVGNVYHVIIKVVGTDQLESECLLKCRATERTC